MTYATAFAATPRTSICETASPGRAPAGPAEVYRATRASRAVLARRSCEAFEELRVRALRSSVDAGDRVVAVTRPRRRDGPAACRIEVELTAGARATLRDGKVVRSRHVLDEAEALEAAGLSE